MAPTPARKRTVNPVSSQNEQLMAVAKRLENDEIQIRSSKRAGDPLALTEQSADFVYARAPGRVNLIGEHTDYNGGYVLPVAIDRQIVVGGCPAYPTDSIGLVSLDFASSIHTTVSKIRFDPGDPWGNYPKGVIKMLKAAGYPVAGFRAVFSGTIPLGAGLSSSAAIEIATATLIEALFPKEHALPPETIAKLCQRAENEFVGVNCGIMDQFISKLGRHGHALFLDCRSLGYEYIPVRLTDAAVVVCNSMVKHKLGASEYNTRRAECERGVELLAEYLPNCRQLRDVTSADLERYGTTLPKVIRKRVEHVVLENERVLKATKALRDGDLDAFGRLMDTSHQSLRDLYEVSCPELDALVDAAKTAGAMGARMTGGGFGGCTVNLVPVDELEHFSAVVSESYLNKFGIHPEIYHLQIVDGASVIDGP